MKTTMKGAPVEMLIDGVWILAVAVRCDLMGNSVTRYYDMEGNRRFSNAVRVCPVYGPEPRREYYTCSCGFRRMRGEDLAGVHAKCAE
jgi:hypothetical protein